MEPSFKKITFAKGKGRKAITVSLHKPLHDALKAMQEETGKKASALVCDALDQYLTRAVLDGTITYPIKGTDSSE